MNNIVMHSLQAGYKLQVGYVDKRSRKSNKNTVSTKVDIDLLFSLSALPMDGSVPQCVL